MDYISDYPKDLNAMHKAIAGLSTSKRADFCVMLNGAMGMEKNICGWMYLINATASQRAEAFLKTLNLWKS